MKNRKDLILVDHEPYTKRRKELFYIQELLDRGVNVQVWDISQYCYPTIEIADTIDKENYVMKVYSLEQLANLLERTDIDNTLFFLEFFHSWKNRKLLKLFSDYKCFSVKVDLYANTMLKSTFIQKIKRILSKSILTGVNNRIHTLLLDFYKYYYHVKNNDFYFSSSAIVPRTGNINHPDYEKYKFYEHPKLIEGDYIVFCDIYFPLHPDYKYFYGLSLSDGTEYRKTMRRFFDFIEKKYKMPVVIAAHPKSDYIGHEFGNRKIIKYQTDNLVYYCQFVVMHNCNSVSYTILANKPIIFISTDEYERMPGLAFYSLKLLASTLGKKVFNIDREELNQVEPTEINRDIREEYIYTYLTSQKTKDIQNIDIIMELLKS